MHTLIQVSSEKVGVLATRVLSLFGLYIDYVEILPLRDAFRIPSGSGIHWTVPKGSRGDSSIA